MSRDLKEKSVSGLLSNENEFIYRAQREGTKDALPPKVIALVGEENIRKFLAGEIDFEDLEAAAEEAENPTYEGSEWNNDALRAELSDRGLEVSGNKKALRQRLMDNDRDQRDAESGSDDEEE